MLSNLPPGVTDSMIEAQVSSKEEEARFDILVEEIEKLIDENCVYTVIEAIEQVCYLKANYLREYWPQPNENTLADMWDNTGKILSKLTLQI
jgi:hypothetical protein